MDTTFFESGFFKNNRKKLLEKLPPKSVVFILANEFLPKNGDLSFKFRQNSTFYYFTGINRPNQILLLSNAHPFNEFNEVLFIEKPDFDKEIWTGRMLTEEQAKKISGIENVYYLENFDSVLGEIMFYAENVFVNNYEQPRVFRKFNDNIFRFIEKLKFLYPLHNYKRLYPLTTQLRLKKEPQEIELIRKAIKLTNEAFLKILEIVRPGIKENEIEAEITYIFKKNLANFGYEPIIACGENNNILHYVENCMECKEKDLLLMDFGAEIYNYTADITRTIPINGKFTDEQKKVYNAVFETLQYVKKQIKPGITIRKLNRLTEEFITDKLLELDYLTKKELDANKKAFKKFYMHGVSHFLGLDVHDVGTKDIPLEAGMVLTCEPGIYKYGYFGIRLENDILVTEDGSEDLSSEIPIKLEEIENLMNK